MFWSAFTVFLCSLSVLAFEIALTRTYSVLFRSPYVFLVVSVAIGGLGLGAMAAAFQRPAASENRYFARLASLSLLMSVALTVVVLLLFGSPMASRLGDAGEIWAVMLVPLIPFFLAGMLLANVFSRQTGASGQLYFADLAGAAAACLLTPWLLLSCGGLNLILVLALLTAFSAFILAVIQAGGKWLTVPAALVLAGTAALLIANARLRFIDLPVLIEVPEDAPYIKPLFRDMANPQAGARLVHTEWSPFARTDLVEYRGVPGKSIWTDGDVPSQMEPFQGRLEDVARLRDYIGFFPYRLRRPDRVLCIGPGGGFDVLLGLLGGAAKIDGVEINPAIARITDRYRDFNGDIYHQPGVTLYTEDGRSFVRRSPERYDLIFMALAKTATTATLGLALGDNYLYTREAFHDYLTHLTPDGTLALVLQDKIQIDRAMVTAVSELMRSWDLPPPEAGKRLLVLTVPKADYPKVGPHRFLLLLRAAPFTDADLAALPELVRQARLLPVYVPGAVTPAPYSVLANPDASLGEIAAAFNDAYPKIEGKALDLSPVSDDRPFYADFSRWLHPQLAALLLGVTLFTILFIGGAAVWLRRAGTVLPASVSPAPQATWPLAEMLAYFAGLGIGFMMIEVVLIQRLVLFLGYPARTLSVIVFALLLFGSLGSLWSQRWPAAGLMAKVRPAAILLALVVAMFSLFGPRLLEYFLPLSLDTRSLVTMVLLAPVGFLLGIPFPSGLRWLQAHGPGAVPAVWGVNGVTSVLGSVVAMSLAKLVGYSATLTLGGAVYLVIAWLADRAMRREKPIEQRDRQDREAER